MTLRDRAVRSIVRQFWRPHGFAGRLAGLEMAVRSSNRRRNAWAVALLDVQPTDRVLEIGFGPGIAIREIASRAVRGRVVGVDHSDVMVAQASRRNAQAIKDGRVTLTVGSAERLPTFEEPFDKILSVNSIMFWPEPVERLAELRSLLRPGGVIAVVRQPRGPGSRAKTKEEVITELTNMLRDAGFVDIRTETMDLKPPVVCALGVKAAT